MSLLSDLLNQLPAKPPAKTPAERPHLKLVERQARPPARTYTNAANATPEWRQARDQYVNHIMVCRSCYAPTSRYCQVGATLRARYDDTPMEASNEL